MRKSLYTYAMVLAMPIVVLMSSCEPRDLNENDVFTSEDQLTQILEAEHPEGYKIYNLNEFLDTFMTEEGNFASDTCPYRTRSTNGNGLFLYAVDTLPTNGAGIYIRGRVTTDDYAGNFYKAIIIQQIVNGEQQNLRISVDMGSSGGMFQLGQEILIRCNGLAVGRYANQPQLCVPSYNNNIYAMNASQKVGWAPGRISSARFRNAVRMIGVPDQSKLKYDTITLKQLYTEIPIRPSIDAAGMDKIRKADGRLIVLKNVWFTGQANDDGSIVNCEYAHPDSSGLANVFAPTTNNIGYPQNRILKDYDGKTICCANSEYCKFASYFLPGAGPAGITNCSYWVGTVTGILGWYLDKASELTATGLTGYEWSVTPRGIPGIGVEDIKLYNEMEGDIEWQPMEFDPKAYFKQ